MSKPLIYLPSNPESNDKVAKLTPEMFERRLCDLTEAVEALQKLAVTIVHHPRKP